jgi:hypothetical protein
MSSGARAMNDPKTSRAKLDKSSQHGLLSYTASMPGCLPRVSYMVTQDFGGRTWIFKFGRVFFKREVILYIPLDVTDSLGILRHELPGLCATRIHHHAAQAILR